MPSRLLTKLASMMASAAQFSQARPLQPGPGIWDLQCLGSPGFWTCLLCTILSPEPVVSWANKTGSRHSTQNLQWLPLHPEENWYPPLWPGRFSRLVPPILSLHVSDPLFCHLTFDFSPAVTLASSLVYFIFSLLFLLLFFFFFCFFLLLFLKKFICVGS